jgi:hypothetical protein
MDTNNKSKLPVELLEELDTLFTFTGGTQNLRRCLVDIFLSYLIESPEGMYPNSYRKNCETIYYLVEFLNRAEDLIKENDNFLEPKE